MTLKLAPLVKKYQAIDLVCVDLGNVDPVYNWGSMYI